MLSLYKSWKENDNGATIFIEGASGRGKSRLGSYVTQLAVSDSISVCLIQGTEIERRT
ncbi:hypothetical protein HDU76_010215 [Blyttiomyces sp. JEL0837]|nr:hypothetical protein HDU76_010215 [Blyttiomyces sp. JEL0837]